jgi:hypothetical protein
MIEAPFRRSAEPAFHRTTCSAAVATRSVRLCGAEPVKYGFAEGQFKPSANGRDGRTDSPDPDAEAKT